MFDLKTLLWSSWWTAEICSAFLNFILTVSRFIRQKFSGLKLTEQHRELERQHAADPDPLMQKLEKVLKTWNQNFRPSEACTVRKLFSPPDCEQLQKPDTPETVWTSGKPAGTVRPPEPLRPLQSPPAQSTGTYTSGRHIRVDFQNNTVCHQPWWNLWMQHTRGKNSEKLWQKSSLCTHSCREMRVKGRIDEEETNERSDFIIK